MKAIWILAAIASLTGATASCAFQDSQNVSQAQTQTPKPATAVDVAIASLDVLEAENEYIGTTAPLREVSVTSRLEGRLLDLKVDIGDRVEKGQAIAQLDDTVSSTTVLEAEAEVAARQAEVSQANAAVRNARVQVERTRLEYQQAQTDANRFTQLAKEGAVSRQTAENAITKALTAEQLWRSAQQEVSVQQQTVDASSQRVLAQKAIRSREQERQSYATITAPMSGIVLERISETGNLLFAGNEVLKLGDFSQVKVNVQISELEISKVGLNQSVDVRIDSFPNQTFTGRVRRISPVADPVARLIPVEIVISNSDNTLGSGQLSRVQFSDRQEPQIMIAETGLEVAGRGNQRPKNASANSQTKAQTDTKSSANAGEKGQQKTGTVFAITGTQKEPKVSARKVTLGDRRDGKVVIRSGLKAGDRIVVRSGGKLRDGDSVRLSILSQQTK